MSLTSDLVLSIDHTDVNVRLQNIQSTAIDLLGNHVPLSSRVLLRNPAWFTQTIKTKYKDGD